MTRRAGRAIAGRVVLLWLGLGAASTVLGAQDMVRGGEIPREAREIIDQTMSPYCPGLLLANCPSPAADTLRRAITARVAAGETRDRITADLLATYGDAVRAAPPTTGFGLVAWLAPFVGLLGAGTWLAYWARRRAAAGGPRPSSPSSRHVPEQPRSDATAPDDGRDERLRRLEALVRAEGH